MSSSKLFVWDFHGTLEYGNDGAVQEITNRVLESEGFTRRLTLEEAHSLSGKLWYEYFSFLLPELNVEACKQLQALCISISQNHPEIISKYIQLTPNALKILEAVEKSPHRQIVLSNTQPKSLDLFLESVKIDHFFPAEARIAADAHCQVRKSKKDFLNAFLNGKTFKALITIGDSPGDVELANCHPNGIGYLFSHPGKPHRASDCPNKIHDLMHVFQEV